MDLVVGIQELHDSSSPPKSEIQKLKEGTEQIMTAKGQICSQILDKQRKVASLGADCCTLTQTLELVHHGVSLSAKLVEKSTYYAKVAEDIDVKFQKLQGWLNCRMPSPDTGVEETLDEEKVTAGGGKLSNHLLIDNMNKGASKELIFSVDSVTAKLDEIKRAKAKLAVENFAMKQQIEQLKSQSNEFQEELRVMDIKTLEKEQKVLLADLVGETEFSSLCGIKSRN
ncbi:uncharacterized protein LOC104429335 isoform X2 [Eucalyptus grandis]|uniref:uncharacterized protein LOC104429335 isoform X2 n=1 Tax=Eucalyptus grandis TaxID=71139 RepID=UPI00192EA8DF|nr:uncharacterized protein LOC104429335 isoform X2 [Eucalyptus grandis]